ncbi:MAG: class I adenylate-forming enzyme family protein [Gulosibacter sp.]|uniref:class I adenylate-forming enzyme family protein n=1 Tax=Gulosibacter sp. TaxID=2817531 RepID=UPI003F93552C
MLATLGQLPYFQELWSIADSTPSATAFIDADRKISYAEMVEIVNQRAHALLTAGLGEGDRVALVAENSADYVLTAFAVWVAKGVLVTIYPSIPAKDVQATIADADPVLVLTDERTHDLVLASVRAGMHTSRIDSEEFVVQGLASSAEPTPFNLREPLHLICYSSGTTSRPKAIMLSAHALHNGAKVYGEVWGLESRDVTLVALPMAWLYGLVTSAMSTLRVGGTVVPLRRSKPELVAETIQRRGVTVLPTVTTVLGKLAWFLENEERRWDLSSLRLIISGGEPRNEQAFTMLREYTGIPVHDTYCPSESFPLITYDPRRDPQPRSGSAGRLVPSAQMRVVDVNGKDVATGEPGEALVTGPGLLLGYWNDPDLTQESIVDGVWYRTHDLVRVDADGYVYVVGRLSDMIIRGGSNVSPGEVESALRQHPAIENAAVVGQPDPDYGEEVVAVVQLSAGASVGDEALRTFVAERLASFKIPTTFVRVNELPMNETTLKINRSKVRQMLASLKEEVQS